MTPQDLIAAFEVLGEAPGGIDSLRVLITDMALRGLLVPQDEADGDARRLAERLASRRTTVIKSQGLKRMPKVPSVEVDTAPHTLPDSWAWVPMCLLARAQAGFAFKSSRFNDVGEGLPLIRIRNVLPGTSDTYYSGAYREEFLVENGDWLVGMDGNFNIARWTGRKALLNQRVTRFQWFSDDIAQSFVMLALQLRLNELHGTKAYTTVQHLSGKQIDASLIPLPPLAEQHRIVARVDELMGLLDRLEAAREARDGTRTALRDAALAALRDADDAEAVTDAWARIAEHMDDLFNDPADVAPLRQAILQLAVRGRLVPQDPEDEPARVLLERIAAEKVRLVKEKKIRRPRPLPLESDNGQDWTIPPSWQWCQIEDLAVVTTGSTPSRREKSYWNGTIPWVSSGEVANCHIAGTRELITGAGLANSSCRILPAGTVLIAMIGQGKTRGQSAVLDIDAASNQNSAALVFPTLDVVPDYVWRWALSQYAESRSGGRGNAQPALNAGKVRALWIPTPPVGEQHRIVAKVDALMALCDDLEARLTAARDAQAAFAAAAVHHLDA